MSTFTTVLSIFAFLAPGFVANEIANGLSPRRTAGRSDTEKVLAMMVFGLLIFAIYTNVHFLNFDDAAKDIVTGENLALLTVLELMWWACCLGIVWGAAKGQWIRRFYHLVSHQYSENRRSAYLGALSVWETLVEQHFPPCRFLKVTLNNGDIFTGRFYLGSDTDSDQELVLQRIRWWTPEEDPERKNVKLVEMEHNPKVYIPLRNVRHIFIYPEDPDSPRLNPPVVPVWLTRRPWRWTWTFLMKVTSPVWNCLQTPWKKLPGCFRRRPKASAASSASPKSQTASTTPETLSPASSVSRPASTPAPSIPPKKKRKARPSGKQPPG